TITSAVADTTHSTTSSPTPKAHDMAYDELLNQVSNDPMPNLGASVPPSPNPAQTATSQSAYGSSYAAPSQATAAENALTSPQGDSTQTPSQASTTAAYGSASNSYNALSYDWSSFAACSTTCGQGYKRRIRRCDVPQRCSDKIEEDVQLCYNAPCEDFGNPWSSYSKCSKSCGGGQRSRSRSCIGRVACPASGSEVQNVPCLVSNCPVLHYDFNNTTQEVIRDISGYGNNAYLENGAQIQPASDVCGSKAVLSPRGDILMEDFRLENKPKVAISIAARIRLQDTRGWHSIFSTAKTTDSGEIRGGFHFEVDDGKLRWFHRNQDDRAVFDVTTSDSVVRANTWHHVMGTYDSTVARAKVFVDGAEKGGAPGFGVLDTDWGYKACIGTFDFDGRYLNGELDDFQMFDYAIKDKFQIENLIKTKCEKQLVKR
ncbi:Hypothetical predicted protein, partial [Paramuricea clavata]